MPTDELQKIVDEGDLSDWAVAARRTTVLARRLLALEARVAALEAK